jgi:hypothetical protein
MIGYVFDLDGCVIDSSHRYRTDKSGKQIDLPHWRRLSIPRFISRDQPGPMFQTAVQKATAHPVAFGTARVVDPATLRWLRVHGLGNVPIYGRRDSNDSRPGVAFKIQAAQSLVSRGCTRVILIDDNAKYCEQFETILSRFGVLAGSCYVPSKQGH